MPKITNRSTAPRTFNAALKYPGSKAPIHSLVTVAPGETRELEVMDPENPVYKAWFDEGHIADGLSEEDQQKALAQAQGIAPHPPGVQPASTDYPNLVLGSDPSRPQAAMLPEDTKSTPVRTASAIINPTAPAPQVQSSTLQVGVQRPKEALEEPPKPASPPPASSAPPPPKPAAPSSPPPPPPAPKG